MQRPELDRGGDAFALEEGLLRAPILALPVVDDERVQNQALVLNDL